MKYKVEFILEVLKDGNGEYPTFKDLSEELVEELNRLVL